MQNIWQSQNWPNFDYDRRLTEPLLAHALEAIGKTRGLLQSLDVETKEQFDLQQVVLEVLSSFGIEGVSLDACQIEQSVIASMRYRADHVPKRRTDAIADLMKDARSGADPLDEARLFNWHRLLFFGIEVEDLGHWRSFDIEIVKSASAGSTDVLYIAPPPSRVASEMSVFLAWLAGQLRAEPRRPAAITAALAHLWFESIHPFSDGNGRIGRALIEHVFAREAALPFSLSRQIEKEKKGYYSALQDARREGPDGEIDATPFVTWFLKCLYAAATAAQAEAHFLIRRNLFFRRFEASLTPRQKKAFELLFDQGPERISEGISARSWTKLTNASSATATRDLAALATLGALKANDKGGRSLAYTILA